MERALADKRQGTLVPPNVVNKIQGQHPQWSADDVVCRICVNKGKASYMEGVLESEFGSLSSLDEDVIEHIREDGLVSLDPGREPPSRFTQLADQLTDAIGSWQFCLFLIVLLVVWTAINIIWRPLEPYPIIVLAGISALLATLAAIEGPIILMSQRRQRERDRQRAENDYLINLKAELEIRYLDEKLDQLMKDLHKGHKD